MLPNVIKALGRIMVKTVQGGNKCKFICTLYELQYKSALDLKKNNLTSKKKKTIMIKHTHGSSFVQVKKAKRATEVERQYHRLLLMNAMVTKV